MSAFIMRTDVLISLGAFAARGGHSRNGVQPGYLQYHSEKLARECPKDPTRTELASYYATVLYRENIRSVNERYPGDEIPDDEIKITITALSRNGGIPAIDVLKHLDCLEYQSCETDDWESTPAHALLNLIRRAAIKSLPGYDEADWG